MSGKSLTTWKSMDEDQPRECKVCGVTLRITKDTIWFRTMKPRWSAHADCAALSEGESRSRPGGYPAEFAAPRVAMSPTASPSESAA